MPDTWPYMVIHCMQDVCHKIGILYMQDVCEAFNINHIENVC